MQEASDSRMSKNLLKILAAAAVLTVFFLLQAAGGIPSGMSVLESCKNECREEASVPEKYLEKLKPVGTVR